MIVGIDASSWSNRRGYGRFTRGLLTALATHQTSHQFFLVADQQTAAQPGFTDAFPVTVADTRVSPSRAASAEGRRALPDIVAMARAASRRSSDLFFFPTVYTWFPLMPSQAVLLGIHDVIAEDFPELIFPARRGQRFWRWKGRLARAQARWILTVSEHARRGIERCFGIAGERIFVVDEAADPSFRKPDRTGLAALSIAGLAPSDRYFVYVGGVNPHKRLDVLMRQLAPIEGVKLVVVGEIESDVFTPGGGALRAAIDECSMRERVILTGWVDDPELAVIFRGAIALVLPSVAEGFGLPAVEAAACGVPVIATANSPLPELLEGGGLFPDPFDLPAWHEAMARLAGDAPLRARLASVAEERASLLSWSRSAAQFVRILDCIERERLG